MGNLVVGETVDEINWVEETNIEDINVLDVDENQALDIIEDVLLVE